MRTFSRFGLYVLAVVLAVALASAALIAPWLAAPLDGHDQALRAQLAGQIDTLIIGQSYAMNGIVPGTLDARLGTVTYNLCGSLMPLYGQKTMLEKELSRNPVRRVILEITPDTFTSDERRTYGNGDSYVVARLDSPGEGLDYLRRCVQPGDWLNVYARLLLMSMRSAAQRLLGRAETIDPANMGFVPLAAQDVSVDIPWARASHRSMSIFAEPLEQNVGEFEELIALCQSAGCEVILVYTPVSHIKVWQLYDQDVFLDWARALAEAHGVALYDFNLLRSRYALLSDATSFSDENHLSAEGAAVFSEAMADVLARAAAGEDVSPLFYSDYQEVIHDSIYWGRQTQ